MQDTKILLGLTTTQGSDWHDKIREIDELDIKELALFPTFLELEQRKELYALLEKTGLVEIPHVHLRDDMEHWELDYFVEKFNTMAFNAHGNQRAISNFKNNRYAKMIFIENHYGIDDDFKAALEYFAGVCLDVSHWEDYGIIQNFDAYEGFADVLKLNKIGCCHISAIRRESEMITDYFTGENVQDYSRHKFKNLSEFEYLKKHLKYLPELVSIELENSFKEQMTVRDYIYKLIK